MTAEPQHPPASGSATPPEQTASSAKPVPPGLPQHTVKRTRISGVWAAVASFAVILLLLLIFILQNGRTVEVSYFGAHGHIPLGAALLLAAVAGILLIALPGGARILQLRVTAHRHRRTDDRQQAVTRPQDQPASPGRS